MSTVPDRAWVLAAILSARGAPATGITLEAATGAIGELIDEGVVSVPFGTTRSARLVDPGHGWEEARSVLDEAWDRTVGGLVGPLTINVRQDATARRLLAGIPPTSTLADGVRLRLHPDLDIVDEEPSSSAPGGWPQPAPPGEDEGGHPTHAEPPDPGATGAEPGEAGADPGEAGAEPPRPDERRLQTRVRDSQGTTLTAGFRAGQRHQISVRIAAEVIEGATVAEARFPAQDERRTVTLDVVLRLRDSRSAPVTRRLRLPPSADTAWTRPATLTLPSTGRTAAVEIVVLHQGRAVQTAVLTGRLLTAPPTPRSRSHFELSVDQTTAAADLPTSTPAGATVVVSTPTAGAPLLFDPARQRVPLDAHAIEAAGTELRSLLYGALAAPPGSLDAAAPVLTRLAILGATLHRHLVAAAGTKLADASWIHIVQLGSTDIPFELAYAHPMPAKDDEVPVCGPARSGATACAGDCADRERSDRVCPFAFWGTGRVVERRVHVSDRRASVTAQPRVTISSGAVVATAKVTDRVDKHASARIASAVEQLVAPGSCHRATGWDDLAREVQSSPAMIVLVTHTAGEGALGTTVEIGSEPRPTYRLDSSLINPSLRAPGPIVLSIGCDTGHLDAGFASWVQTVQDAQASVVVSALSPVPGRAVADFVERFATALGTLLAEPGEHRCGAALTRARQQTLAAGDLLGLALTATGDGDIRLASG